MLLPLLDPSNFFWMVKPGGKNTESVLFSVTVKKYEHVEHCVSLVWHWSMCSGKFGQPAAPSERDETVTGAWRTMPNVCKISRKIGNFCRISVTRAWRECDQTPGALLEHWWQIYSFISISSGPNLFTCWLEYPIPAPFSDIFWQKWHNINLTLPEKEKYQHKIGRGWDEARSVL